MFLGVLGGGLAAGELSAQEPLESTSDSDWIFASSRAPTAPRSQSSTGDADTWDWARADARAPAGIAYTDTLDEDEWMLRLSYGHVEQEGLRDGSDDLSNSEIFASGYSTAPQEMTTDVFDMQLLYGVDGLWTLFAEMPWI